MEKEFTNLNEAIEYVFTQLQNVNPDITKEDVTDSIIDEILESTEYAMIDEDDRFLEESEKDVNAINDFLQTKISNYPQLLLEVVSDILDESAEAK